MADREKKDAQTREILLTAARGLVAEDPNFSLKTLLTKTGLSRAAFRRCFAGKEELLAALTGQEVRGLSEILEVAQPAAQPVAEPVRRTVGSDVAPAPAAAPSVAPAAPPADAWLERRLRVFERALAGLEKRQEKSEQTLTLQLGLIGEKLAVLAQPVAAVVQSAPEPAPLLRRKPLLLKPDEIKPAETKPGATKPEIKPEMKPAEPVAMEPVLSEPAQLAFTGLEPAPAETAQAPSEENDELTPAAQAFVAEIAAVPEPVGEKEIADFIAHARRVAQNAAIAATLPPAPRRLQNLRWLAWSGAVLVTLMFCTGLLLASGAFGGQAGAHPVSAQPVVAQSVSSGVTHRQVAHNGMARLIALADSGDAAAQTVLALNYLKGEGVAGDDEAARRWSLAAASQGQPVAEYLLGTLYLEGQRDEKEAARWFLAAAAQGNIKAMHNLAIAYAQGEGVEKDPAASIRWFMRAAAQGYRDSEFDLAVLYERGLGVPQSARAALKWYRIAAAQGDAPSAARAAFLQEQMDPMEIQAAVNEAGRFLPQPMGSAANTLPSL